MTSDLAAEATSSGVAIILNMTALGRILCAAATAGLDARPGALELPLGLWLFVAG